MLGRHSPCLGGQLKRGKKQAVGNSPAGPAQRRTGGDDGRRGRAWRWGSPRAEMKGEAVLAGAPRGRWGVPGLVPGQGRAPSSGQAAGAGSCKQRGESGEGPGVPCNSSVNAL